MKALTGLQKAALAHLLALEGDRLYIALGRVYRVDRLVTSHTLMTLQKRGLATSIWAEDGSYWKLTPRGVLEAETVESEF